MNWFIYFEYGLCRWRLIFWKFADDLPFSICAPIVVFGRVEKGMDVVKAIEAVGSGSGATSASVVVKDCGEMKSKKS